MSDGVVPCTCDPTQESINDPNCPTHGAEIRRWNAWSEGKSRCPYCVDVDPLDFDAMCDCPRFDAELAVVQDVIPIVFGAAGASHG